MWSSDRIPATHCLHDPAVSLHPRTDSLHRVACAAGVRHTGTMNVLRSRVWWFAAGFWTLFGAISGMQIWISMIAHGHSLVRVVIFQVVVWDLWIPFSFAILRLLRG